MKNMDILKVLTELGGYRLEISKLIPSGKHCYVIPILDESGKFIGKTKKIKCGVYEVYMTRRNIACSFRVAAYIEDDINKNGWDIVEHDFQDAIKKDRNERRIQYNTRRREFEQSKKYPKQITIKFKNTNIRLVEQYISLDKKEWKLFIGNLTNVHPDIVDIDKSFNLDEILMDIHKSEFMDEHYAYLGTDFTPKSEKIIDKTTVPFLPMWEYLGKSVKYHEQIINITNLNFDFGVWDFLEYKVIESTNPYTKLVGLTESLKYIR